MILFSNSDDVASRHDNSANNTESFVLKCFMAWGPDSTTSVSADTPRGDLFVGKRQAAWNEVNNEEVPWD